MFGSFWMFYYMGVGRPQVAPKYSPKVPQQFPHQGKPFPDFSKNQNFGDQQLTKFRPLKNPNLAQDLDIDCVPNLWDPSREMRSGLLYRKFILILFDLSGESSYRIFRRKTYPETQIVGGRIFDYFLKIREYVYKVRDFSRKYKKYEASRDPKQCVLKIYGKIM